MRGLENYSSLDEGALYRFNWVFPSNKTIRGSLGFGQGSAAQSSDTYAHLADDQIDAKLLVEVRDHPLFLFPVAERRALLERLFREGEPPNVNWRKSRKRVRTLTTLWSILIQRCYSLSGTPMLIKRHAWNRN